MKSFKYASLGLALLASVACTKDFEEINKNNNSPESVPLSNILGGIIRTTDINVINEASYSYANCLSQQIARPQYNEVDRYIILAQDPDNIWRDAYRAIKNADNLIADATVADNQNYQAIGKVMRAVNFNVIVDLWGDAPYSEAVDYSPETGVTTVQPAFDKEADIYNGIIAELKAAAGMLKAGNGEIGDGDFIYNGDAAQWAKFANSLIVRIYVKTGKTSELAAFLGTSPSLFTSNADDADVPYGATSSTWNPIYDNLVGRTDFSSSKTMVDQLSNSNDPRLAVYAQKGGDDTYVGYPSGELSVTNKAAISKLGTAYGYTPDASRSLMTFAELSLLLAEAAEKGDISGVVAKDLYEAGVTADITKNGLTAGDAAAFLAGAGSYDAAANAEDLIIEQIWVATFLEGVEGWNIIRRTGKPAFVTEAANASTPGSGLPDRLPYPPRERATNEGNLDAAISRQNLDAEQLYTPLSWGK